MNSSAFTISATEAAVVLRGAPVAAETQRQPIHLALCIDVSDSMSDGHKLANVCKSLEFLLPLFSSQDAVSIVTFGEQAATLLPLTPASHSDLIRSKIAQLHTDGCTNMSAGLMEVGPQLEPAGGAPARKQGVLLLTDGHANRGDSSPEGLKRIVQRMIEDNPGLTVTTVGYGHDHNSGLLSEIATVGGGSYNVVNTLENVATVFGEVMGGLATVVAQNVKVQYSEGLEPMTGYATDKVVRTVSIGDIYAENEVVVLFRVADPATARLNLTYHDLQAVRTVAQPLELGPTPVAIPKTIEVASFRFRVSQLLKDVSAALGVRNRYVGVSRLLSDDLKTRAEALLAQLRELSYAAEQIIQMMIDDLESLLEAEEVAETTPGGLAPAALHATTSAWVQHSAYLDLGRGLRTASMPIPAAPAAPAGPPAWGATPAAPLPGGPPLRHAVHWGLAAGGSARSRSVSPVGDPMASAPSAPLARTRTARVDPFNSPFSNRVQSTARESMYASASAGPPPSSQTPDEES
jgi:hypothetical protein